MKIQDTRGVSEDILPSACCINPYCLSAWRTALSVFKMFRPRFTFKEYVALFSIPFMFSVFIIYHTPPDKETYMYLRRNNITREYSKPTKKSASGKRKLLLFVVIHSAPSRLDRRNAIRETWMKECQTNPDAVCWFITDGQDAKGQPLEGVERIKLENESRVYGDILLAEAPGGVNFAVQYLWMLEWANKTYDFQYFLRLDDDYFICFRKLMMELKARPPQQNFQWGWLHCDLKAATWLDESFYLVSKDIVESIISRRDSLVCNVWESQSIGYWLKDIPNLATFSDNKRLLHHQTGLENGGGKRTEICHSFLGIHKSYPEKMRTFWGIYEKEDKPLAYQVPPITYNCKYSIAMDIMAWKNNKFWFSELKLCKDNPIWNSNRDYKGRQGS